MDSADRNSRRPYTFDRVVRIMFTVFTLFGVVFLLDALKGVLLPFLVACVIAYLLEPIVKWNMRWTHIKTRLVPVMLTLLEAMAIVTICCIIFVPYLISEASQMANMIRHYATTQFQIPYISESIHSFIRDNIDFNELARMLSKEEWTALIKSTLTSSWNFLSSGLAIIFGILSWLIVILYIIFIMLDYERIMLGFKKLVHVSHPHRTFRVINEITKYLIYTSQTT
ncbi:MAG: AI-2E family transporter, partial [Muribaculaceae bacterium]|nr:AI-2E family transporter [Muribaculaceae bacterium]